MRDLPSLLIGLFVLIYVMRPLAHWLVMRDLSRPSKPLREERRDD